MSAEYGSKGCRCWRGEDYNPWDDRTHHEWMPNAACPHHGLLADFTERRDTGAYTVISKPVTIEPRQDLSTPPDGPECPPGLHSMFDPCPGGCLNGDEQGEPDDWGPYARGGFLRPGPTRTSNDTGEPETVSWPCDEGEDLRTGSAYTHGPCPPECGANPMDCPGPDADRCLSPTTEQERQRGLRAAVRRAWDRVGRAVYGDAWPYWF